MPRSFVSSAVIDNGNRRRLTVAMPLALSVGTYTVKWKSLSADDGDPAKGEFTFTFDPNAVAKAGKETLREEAPSATATAPSNGVAPVISAGAEDGGTSWVLVVAVAVGMFVVGGGTTFLLVQKRP